MACNTARPSGTLATSTRGWSMLTCGTLNRSMSSWPQRTPRTAWEGGLGAGTLGLTMMGGWDLYGLATPGFRQCGYETGVDRWIGGLGHELGHALGLPHPPGCDDGSQPCDVHALMYLGYASWPHTYLRDDDMAVLRASPFIR